MNDHKASYNPLEVFVAKNAKDNGEPALRR